MLRRTYPLLLAMTASCIAPAYAQGDAIAMAHAAAANQLGVLEYCQGRGDVGADALQAERSVLSHMPPSPVSTTEAEALGRQGTLAAPNGAQATLASMASTRNTTVSALCQQMGSSALQSAAIYRESGMPAGGMPPGGMAGMPAMPQMPGMPNMPAMGNMPSMPGAPTYR